VTGLTTLYRHWPDVASLIHDAIDQRIGQARSPRSGELRADLISELNGLRMLLHDRASEHTMRAVLERAPLDPAFASLKGKLYPLPDLLDSERYCGRPRKPVISQLASISH
jgi:hypothetical protein